MAKLVNDNLEILNHEISIVEKGDVYPLYAKLFEIQAEDLNLTKDGTNPHFKNRYSTLNNNYKLLKPILIKYKLLIMFISSFDKESNKDLMLCRIIDVENKSSLTASVQIDMTKGPQQAGSQLTYFKRYLIEGLFALPVTDDTDDDGEGATKEWLNENSENYQNVVKAIQDGRINDIAMIYKKYKLNAVIKSKLEVLLLKQAKK